MSHYHGENIHGHFGRDQPRATVYRRYDDHNITVRQQSVGYSNASLKDEIVCCVCLTTLLAVVSKNPSDFAFSCIIAITAIIIISCLATLAMSVTGETLLSIFLIGIIAAGLAAICRSQKIGCCAAETTDREPNFNPQEFRP